jgi:toxin ParE1/3/4
VTLFSPRAQRELRDALLWIEKDNPAAADALLATAMAAARRLQASPKLGHVRLDLASARYRFWSLRGFPYLLVYDAEAQPPIILRVVHQSRDLPAILDFGPGGRPTGQAK